MNPGFVYILTNESMPGLVKIGRTARDVDLRASELWQTGVPTRFEVWASEKTCDCVQLEAYMHRDLRKHRVSKSREFFRVEPWTARGRLQFWAEHQAFNLINEHFSCSTAVPFRTWVDESTVEILAKETGNTEEIVARAMAMISADELAGAIARVRAESRDKEIEILRQIGIPEDEWEGMLNA